MLLGFKAFLIILMLVINFNKLAYPSQGSEHPRISVISRRLDFGLLYGINPCQNQISMI